MRQQVVKRKKYSCCHANAVKKKKKLQLLFIAEYTQRYSLYLPNPPLLKTLQGEEILIGFNYFYLLEVTINKFRVGMHVWRMHVQYNTVPTDFIEASRETRPNMYYRVPMY